MQSSLSTKVRTVIGVDFSGAALAGKNAWLAEFAVRNDFSLDLLQLNSIGQLAKSETREAACQYLVHRISASSQTLFGLDFPFGLPIELGLGSWTRQLQHIHQFKGGAPEYGRALVEMAKSTLDKLHVRRQTDTESRTPFDCYHYRIIYQTFHGMRDVLRPISKQPQSAVLPFQYSKANEARHWVGEVCPSSTLKRLALPSRMYKQTSGEKLIDAKMQVRQEILAGLRPYVTIRPKHRRVMMRNLGGDALDAVVAGIGVWSSFRNVDHILVSKHERYPIEGYVYH
jgi:hypothetical protein